MDENLGILDIHRRRQTPAPAAATIDSIATVAYFGTHDDYDDSVVDFGDNDNGGCLRKFTQCVRPRRETAFYPLQTHHDGKTVEIPFKVINFNRCVGCVGVTVFVCVNPFLYHTKSGRRSACKHH